MPKALLVNASPRKRGNTAAMLADVAAVLDKAGVETEIIAIAGRAFRGCTACGGCKQNQDRRCAVRDSMTEPIAKALDADAIIIGSPTYFSDVTAECKAFIDRLGYVSRANGFALARKIGAAVVPARRAGAIHVINSIHHVFTVNKMFVAGSSYWPLALARDPGDYANDAEGVQTMKDLGANIAWFLERTAD